MAERVRRARPNANGRQARAHRLELLPIPYDGTVRTHARGAADRPQSPFGFDRGRSGNGDGISWLVGILPRSCATIAQVLSPNGYATGWWGKDHNTPDSHTSPAGPFTHWPTGLGFDYFYGFVGGETDQFYPALFRNTVPVQARTRPDDGYHLTTDLADDCIAWMRTQKAIAPERPFFVHFAPGAAHGPHQPPLEWRGRNAGRFAIGWDRYREEVMARQLEIGVVAPGTRLTRRPEEIPAWDSFTADERMLFQRQAENFADFLEHTDYEVGRLVQSLADMRQLENTLFVYILPRGRIS
jgi:arylsulfatase A-like enzyme